MAHVQSGVGEVKGNVAHDETDVGNPVKIGGKANANEPNAVGDGDRVDGWFDQQGRLVTAPGFPANLVTSTHGLATGNPTGTGNTEIVAAPGAGVSIHVTGILVGNSGAALREVTLKDATTGRLTQPLAADGGGFNWETLSPPWKLAANSALNASLDAAGDVHVTVNFYVSA